MSKHELKMHQSDWDQLDLLAYLNDLEPGQMVCALIELVHLFNELPDHDAAKERFLDLLKLAVINSGDAGGWGAGAPGVHIEPGTGKADMRELQERIRQYEAGEID
jgi:hypothetical protein